MSLSDHADRLKARRNEIDARLAVLGRETAQLDAERARLARELDEISAFLAARQTGPKSPGAVRP